MITETAFAKINLTLSVGKRRDDGYHNIDSVMHSISLHDTVTLEEGNEVTLEVVRGNAPSGRDNLMVKAAELFLSERNISRGVHMTLSKEIPSEAGMGGGSSDAAAVLRGLARLFGTGDSLDSLAAMGASLGADVPFCVKGGAARCEGIGEKLTSLPAWEGLPLLILRPDTSVSTGKAYALLDKREISYEDKTELCLQSLYKKDRKLLFSSLSNDFENVLFSENPLLHETAETLSSFGRPFLMTGSGSAFFLFPESREEGLLFRNHIKKSHFPWFAEMAETVK